MIGWLRRHTLLVRVPLYAVGAVLLFGLAVGLGAAGALMLQGGGLPWLAGEEPRPPGQQQNASDPQEQGSAAGQGGSATEREEASQPRDEQQNAPQQAAEESRLEREEAARQAEAEYTGRVGEIQAASVQRTLDSHEKLLRYDALTANDIEELRANQAALEGLADEVAGLAPPQRYAEQYEVFRSAVSGLRDATRLGYDLAADPTAATAAAFEGYDRRLAESADRLRRSNDLLGMDYETIGDVQATNPLT